MPDRPLVMEDDMIEVALLAGLLIVTLALGGAYVLTRFATRARPPGCNHDDETYHDDFA